MKEFLLHRIRSSMGSTFAIICQHYVSYIRKQKYVAENSAWCTACAKDHTVMLLSDGK